MSKSAATILFGVISLVALSGSAAAANRKAQEMVAGLTQEQATILSKFPALAQIDSEIRADCSAKNKGRLPTDDFCGCASAVTMSAWRSGIDPNMVPRLTEYLKNPTADAAKAFLQYQGPELYRGLCEQATKR